MTGLVACCLLACALFTGVNGGLREEFVNSTAFRNFTLNYLDRHPELNDRFSMCENAFLNEKDPMVVQGFLPCPYPSHGVGTRDDPGGACTLGSNREATMGAMVLRVVTILPSIFVGVRTVQRVRGRRKKHPKQKSTGFDRIEMLNVALSVLDVLYSVDVDGRAGILPFVVPHFLGNAGIFVILSMLFTYTNSVITASEATSSLRSSAKESFFWKTLFRIAMVGNALVNLVSPLFLELAVLTTATDSLLTPKFGEAGIGNFLGWYSGTMRSLRLIALVLISNSYMASSRRAEDRNPLQTESNPRHILLDRLCAISTCLCANSEACECRILPGSSSDPIRPHPLPMRIVSPRSNLRRQLALHLKHCGLNSDTEVVAARSSMKILRKLSRQQLWVSVCCMIGGINWAVSATGIGKLRLVVPPCTFFGGFMDFGLHVPPSRSNTSGCVHLTTSALFFYRSLLRVVVGIVVFVLLRPEEKAKRVKPSQEKTSIVSSAGMAMSSADDSSNHSSSAVRSTANDATEAPTSLEYSTKETSVSVNSSVDLS